jgi:uroporphyrinogen-III decarboxylase
MTGREKIEAALSLKGGKSIPAVVPYESIMVRDHWEELVSNPWWDLHSSDLQVQMQWRGKVLKRIENDFLELLPFYPREEREALAIEQNQGEVLLIDRRTGKATRLEREPIGGFLIESLLQKTGFEARSPADIDRLVPPLEREDPNTFLQSGKADLAVHLVEEYGKERYPICSAKSPLWACHSLWGFEPLMRNIAAAPDLVRYACRRYLDYARHRVRRAAAMGAAGIWIEECLTDLVSPETYASLSLTYLQQLVEGIHSSGLSAILYFCGDPSGKLELILKAGCDAVGFEESKKDFQIDIEKLTEQISGRCALLGNIDAVQIVGQGSEQQLRAEISRQIQAGCRNGNRFIISCGSPITPATSIERVCLYLHLTRELGEPASAP